MKDESGKIGKLIISALQKDGTLGMPTPLMFTPDDFSPTVGVTVETEEGIIRLAYNIKIKFLGKETNMK